MKPTLQDVFLDRVCCAVRAAVVEAIVEYDAGMKREAVKLYKEAKRANRVEGSKPYGHPDHPEEKQVLSMILNLRKQKYTVREIMKELESSGIKARRGRWNPGSLLRILKRSGMK